VKKQIFVVLATLVALMQQPLSQSSHADHCSGYQNGASQANGEDDLTAPSFTPIFSCAIQSA